MRTTIEGSGAIFCNFFPERRELLNPHRAELEMFDKKQTFFECLGNGLWPSACPFSLPKNMFSGDVSDIELLKWISASEKQGCTGTVDPSPLTS